MIFHIENLSYETTWYIIHMLKSLYCVICVDMISANRQSVS